MGLRGFLYAVALLGAYVVGAVAELVAGISVAATVGRDGVDCSAAVGVDEPAD